LRLPPTDVVEREIIIAVMGMTGITHIYPKPATYQLRQLLGEGRGYFVRGVSGISDIEVSGDLYACKIFPCWGI